MLLREAAPFEEAVLEEDVRVQRAKEAEANGEIDRRARAEVVELLTRLLALTTGECR